MAARSVRLGVARTRRNVAVALIVLASLAPLGTRSAQTVLWACGYNGMAQLGDGTRASRSAPVLCRLDAVPNDIVQVACGYDHALALDSAGGVWAWGSNWDGQLGDSTRVSRTVPQRVPGIPPMSQIAAGYGFSLALEASGTVWSWGSNWHGQLGDASSMFRAAPAAVAGLSGITRIAAGKEHALAADSNGAVCAWGANASGQLGDGTLVDRFAPVVVAQLGAIRQLSGGSDHSLALTEAGTAYAWGAGWAGQLGLGSLVGGTVPAPIPDARFDAVAAGANHCLAVRSGAALAWGRNSHGQLGSGNLQDRTAPTGIGGLAELASVAAGGGFSLAVSSSGRLLSWGDGSDGQLAGGSPETDRMVPGEVPIHDAVAASAGNDFFVVVSRPRTLAGTFADATWVGPKLPKLTLELRPVGGSAQALHLTVQPGGEGTWVATVPSSAPSGTWAVYASASHWLRKRLGEFTVSMDGVAGIAVTLANGDVDGDNAITVFDYVLLSDAFESADGDANWNAGADLDGDGAVTAFDYGILSANFDQFGDD